MFAVNLSASCFDSMQDSVGKKNYKNQLGKGRLPAAIYAS